MLVILQISIKLEALSSVTTIVRSGPALNPNNDSSPKILYRLASPFLAPRTKIILRNPPEMKELTSAMKIK
jgi:hypothetical protein